MKRLTLLLGVAGVSLSAVLSGGPRRRSLILALYGWPFRRR